MKTIRLMLSMLLAVVTYSSGLAQGIIIYKSNGTQEKLPYVAVDSIIPYYADKTPVQVVDPQPVDLGLPSGTLWADINVGASAPEGTGGFYAWGETEEKLTYSWDNYMCSSDQCAKSSDPLVADGILKVDKSYSTILSVEGSIAGTKYDVATQKWDESWVMPTVKQFNELIDNCTCSYVTINDVSCAEYTGPNGNSVIFPLSGGYKQNAQVYDTNILYCWTAEMKAIISGFTEAKDAKISSYGISLNYYPSKERYIGLQIRPVKKKEAITR